jgi:hypothetical protein
LEIAEQLLGGYMFSTTKEAILKALLQYNENEIHQKLQNMTDEQKSKIEDLADKYLFTVSPIAKAVVTACIEYVEGKTREIKRK